MKWSHFDGFVLLLLCVTLTSAKSLIAKENVKSDSSKVHAFLEGIAKDSHDRKSAEPLAPVLADQSESRPRRLNLDYGQLREQADKTLPEPVLISSQPITVNRRHSAGSVGNKRSRNLNMETTDAAVKVIEGVRVPDNEEDKFHTWRNARVIKGMLVPKGRSPQPHKKRQIMVQDATQYLAAHGLTVPQFQQLYQQQQQQQGQSPIIDAAAFQAVAQAAVAQQQQQQQQQQNIIYASPSPQPQPLQQQQYFAQDLNTGAIYATPAPLSAQQQFHTITASPIPIQTVTATPVVLQADGQLYSGGNNYPSNSQFHARVGAEFSAPIMELSQLHPVSKPQVSIYSPSSPKQPDNVAASSSVEFKPMPSAEPQNKIQVNQNQNSAQTQSVKIQEAQSQTNSIVVPQGGSTLIQTAQQVNAQQQLQQQVPQLIQVHDPQQQQQQPQQVAQLVQVHGIDQQQHQQQQQQLTAQVIQVQQQHHQVQQLQQVDPNRPVTQIIQLQPQQQQQQQFHTLQQIPGQPQAYILQPSPSMNPNTIEDRNSPVYPETNNRYVIKPHTYVAGPGGQMFTVPVPIPEEEEEHHEHPSHPHPHHQQANRRREGDRERDDRPHRNERPGSAFMHKVIDALAVNKKTIERVETNVALPVLATAGVLFGLGALAAGWYLSSQNREVGLLRRTGKPQVSTVGGVNLKRTRRQAAEVDQAGFFQSIIQHAIEKQQKEFEETVEPATSANTNTPTGLSVGGKMPIRGKPTEASNSRLDETEFLDKGSHGHVTHVKPVKHKKRRGHWLASKEFVNFAKVAIPAVVLGGAVIAIAALIFGWYISGSNREIAFLEPSAYSRRKRDLTTTSLSDSWVQRLLSSIHKSPYEAEHGSQQSYDPDTSKGNSFDFKADLSSAVVAVSLASVAFLTMLAIVLAWFFSENEREVNWLETGGVGFGGWPNHYRRARSISTNSIEGAGTLSSTQNPGFLASILTDLEVSQSRLIKKLQDSGYAKWQETPCAKRIFCDVMSTQSDDTIRAMEKRMVTFVSMLPNSVSSSLSRTLGDVMNSIHRRDCSAFTCKGHWVDPSQPEPPSPPANQPR